MGESGAGTVSESGDATGGFAGGDLGGASDGGAAGQSDAPPSGGAGGVKSGDGAGGAMGTPGAPGKGGAAGSNGLAEPCNDLSVGDSAFMSGVVNDAPPTSLGGTLLAGTFDLERREMYIRDGLDADSLASCQSLAGGDATKASGQRQTFRFVALDSGQFRAEFVLQAAGDAGIARATAIVTLTGGKYLDQLSGTPECAYSHTPNGDTLKNDTYVRSAGFLGYDYVSTFTVDADSLVIVDGASFPETGPAYCSRLSTFRRR